MHSQLYNGQAFERYAPGRKKSNVSVGSYLPKVIAIDESMKLQLQLFVQLQFSI